MDLTQKAINYVQAISAEIIVKADSGHTGVALGASAILFALFKDHYLFDTRGEHVNRDRFVLSAGHASALYYTLLHVFGFNVSLEDLENFRQLNSKTSGHPELKLIRGIECTTGPLGQGVANAVGMAIASKHYAKLFNVLEFNIFDNKTYCFVGDGDLMEGVALEAISLAGHLKLNNLILLYDYNNITADGKLNLSNDEDIVKKFEAQGWKTIFVNNGNDYESVTKAIGKAKKETQKPVIVIFKTKIGYKSERENDHKIHGMELTDAEFLKLKEKLGITTNMFIPNSILKFCRLSTDANNRIIEEWTQNLILYKTTHPELFRIFEAYTQEGKFTKEKMYKIFSEEKGRINPREANKKILNEIASKIPSLIGGSADLVCSTKTYIEGGKDITSEDFSGKNIYFGVREHAMAAICNGITLFDGTRTFCSTFLVFSNYMMPAIRMSAMMNLPVWYFFSHDSIFVGEDGPTHQPVEQITQLRAVPNLLVFRPCDPIELIDCFDVALKTRQPCAFLYARQSLPILAVGKEGEASKGAYVLESDPDPIITFLASGSEVELVVNAKKLLNKEDIPVEIISFPSVDLYEKLKKPIVPKGSIVIAVEASNDYYWHKFTKNILNIDEVYGKSGKSADVANFFGFTTNQIINFIRGLIKKK